ncbi:MAG: DUF460 domain-containing protein [Desulfurococcales archaeon]|nr:DUF460 domain-containing protein [Desulfurococcales archaeon]
MARSGGPLYMGVDLHYGNPASARGARYYIVVVDTEGGLVAKAPESSIARLVRLAWEYRPRAIAVDNPYELAQSTRDLVRILSMLPPDVMVIQVNMDDEGLLDVREAARRAGLDPGQGKLSPGRTAYLLAVLASRGVGKPLRVVEEKTLITVSRGRGGSAGGWSQQRFQRRVRATIHAVATKIKEELDKAGLEYDYRYRRSKGGLESAVFTVYAPRSRLRGVVKPYRGPDYSVEVKPVYRAKIYLEEGRGRPVIVGLDPGISTGLAIMDLAGRILHLASYKGIDRGGLIQEILAHGSPIIVAADVNPPPDTVRNIASKLGAEVYTPPQDMTTEEKRELASRIQGAKPRDSHQRDALAAAYKAYQALLSKMRQIDSYLGKFDLELDPEEVKAEVLRGTTLAEAVERQIMRIIGESRRGEEKPRVARREQRQEAGEGVDYAGIIEGLKAEKRRLEDKIAALEAELERERINARLAIQGARAEAYRDQELRTLRSRVERLEEEARKLRSMIEDYKSMTARLAGMVVDAARGNLVLAARVKVLTSRNVNRIPQGTRILLVEDSNTFERAALEKLAEAGVEGVIVEPGPLANALRKAMIPALRPIYRVVEEAGVVLVESRALEDALEERRRLEEERASRVDLERLITEYRMRRMKA